MKTVLFEAHGAVARIRLNRPEALNTFDAAMFDELNIATARFRDDPALKVAIVSGKRAFSAGIDLRSYAANLEAGVSRAAPRMVDLADPEYCAKPVIAAIRGYCVGEGVHLALACDFRVCASDAIFSVPEVSVGMALTRLSWQCARTIGMPAAIELCMLCEKKDAQWALARQLVHRVTLPGEEMSAAEAMAERLCSLSAPALQATRRTLYKAHDLDYRQMLEFGLPLRAAVLDAGDARIGTRAFLDKQKPVFGAKS